ncbi:hypothetical protein A3715_11275 [Oleiphilus sp. HI0009]|nr:hypothetical protein A3715_24860 [Oleiphilus sp. HI0009]KZX77287.1 hypothetical protein A3715_11275 [Oleiphilus sp. HI0009]
MFEISIIQSILFLPVVVGFAFCLHRISRIQGALKAYISLCCMGLGIILALLLQFVFTLGEGWDKELAIMVSLLIGVFVFSIGLFIWSPWKSGTRA